ncbi:MAG: hypothetical protein EPN23_04080 [Verrucomicrobia bacterium]|nr:MAG: hypothetical protein EPN23_04080 [Verrucomicrobiota bacterium]
MSTHQAQPSVQWGRLLMQFAVAAGFATYLTFHRHHPWVGSALYTIAALLLMLGLLWPAAWRRVDAFGQRLGHWVGVGLTVVLLVPFFYLAFIPLRLFQVLLRRDPLQRRWESQRASYWEDRPAITDANYFTRQY